MLPASHGRQSTVEFVEDSNNRCLQRNCVPPGVSMMMMTYRKSKAVDKYSVINYDFIVSNEFSFL